MDGATKRLRDVLKDFKLTLENMSWSSCNDNHDNEATDKLYEIEVALAEQSIGS